MFSLGKHILEMILSAFTNIPRGAVCRYAMGHCATETQYHEKRRILGQKYARASVSVSGKIALVILISSSDDKSSSADELAEQIRREVESSSL